jgi:ribonuclease HII
MARKKFDLSLLPPKPNLEFEQPLWRDGLAHIAGVDEAGRGALAGPVAVGVVVLPDRPDLLELLAGVQDSKQMTARARQHWAEIIPQVAVDCQVGFAGPEEIDEIGIVHAIGLAARRALEELSSPPEHLLLDARLVPDAGIPETSLIKGDCRSLSIAASAIMAKVARDRIMVEMSEQYPAYGFEHNMGYGTAVHRNAIAEHGPCKIHRFSFAPIRQDEPAEDEA